MDLAAMVDCDGVSLEGLRRLGGEVVWVYHCSGGRCDGSR
jgi:hypothetical protein